MAQINKELKAFNTIEEELLNVKKVMKSEFCLVFLAKREKEKDFGGKFVQDFGKNM